MDSITAVLPILYRGKQYMPGSRIPCDDQEQLEAWKRAGSVAVHEEEPEKPKVQKARSVSAEAGIPAEGEAESVIGKIPKTSGRAKK